MFISSIIFISTHPIPIETELEFISAKREDLFFGVSFFESLKPKIWCSLFKMTAAATTGPASGPLPTSSTPAIIFVLMN